jgi:hypothetical protein
MLTLTPASTPTLLPVPILHPPSKEKGKVGQKQNILSHQFFEKSGISILQTILSALQAGLRQVWLNYCCEHRIQNTVLSENFSYNSESIIGEIIDYNSIYIYCKISKITSLSFLFSHITCPPSPSKYNLGHSL